MQNESETEFHRVYKVSPTQQLTKLTHLLRESGAAVVAEHLTHLELFIFDRSLRTDVTSTSLTSLLITC